MAHKEIELILTRQLADSLALPIFLVDVDGTLLFYNEPAEKILGRRFEETGPLSGPEWRAAFAAADDEGKPAQGEDRVLTTALTQRRPAHALLRIRCFDGVVRRLQITGIPLIGRGDRFLGAVAIFWEAKQV